MAVVYNAEMFGENVRARFSFSETCENIYRSWQQLPAEQQDVKRPRSIERDCASAKYNLEFMYFWCKKGLRLHAGRVS